MLFGRHWIRDASRGGSRGILFQSSKEFCEAKSKQPRLKLTLKQTLLLTVFRILKERLVHLAHHCDPLLRPAALWMFGLSFLGFRLHTLGLLLGDSMTLRSFCYIYVRNSMPLSSRAGGGLRGPPLLIGLLEVVDDGCTWPLLLAARPASAHDDPTPCQSVAFKT